MARAGAAGDTAPRWTTCCAPTAGAASAKGTSSLAQMLARRDGAGRSKRDGDRGHALPVPADREHGLRAGDYDARAGVHERVSRTFRSGVGLVDYVGRPDAARETINPGSRADEGRIQKLLGADRRHPGYQARARERRSTSRAMGVRVRAGEHRSPPVHHGGRQGDPRPDDGDARRTVHPARPGDGWQRHGAPLRRPDGTRSR